jgi:hypothetical protein
MLSRGEHYKQNDLRQLYGITQTYGEAANVAPRVKFGEGRSVGIYSVALDWLN